MKIDQQILSQCFPWLVQQSALHAQCVASGTTELTFVEHSFDVLVKSHPEIVVENAFLWNSICNLWVESVVWDSTLGSLVRFRFVLVMFFWFSLRFLAWLLD